MASRSAPFTSFTGTPAGRRTRADGQSALRPAAETSPLPLDPASRQSRRRAAEATLARAQAERYDATLGEELERAIATELQIDEPDLRAFNEAKQQESAGSGEARKADRPSGLVARPAVAPGGEAADAAREAEELFQLSEGFGPLGDDPDLYRDSQPHGSPLLILTVALAVWAGIILGLLEAYDWAKGAF